MMTLRTDRKQMKEVPAPMIVKPFGKVHYWDMPTGSGCMVRTTILMESKMEGGKIGIAIDGSGSMRNLFPPSYDIFPPPFHRYELTVQVKMMSAYSAKRSADGKVVVIYWATGPSGKDIQVFGDLTAEDVEELHFGPPDHYGQSTQLLPALEYFTDGQQRSDLYDAPWGMYVFITDGQIEDMDAVKQYCTQLAKDIDTGRHNNLKLVIIGLGNQVDKDQLRELDDLGIVTGVDLWDTTLAPEVKHLLEIFSEVVDRNIILVPGDGIIKDDTGNVIMHYRDTGLPYVLEFILPPGAKSFSLEIAGRTVTQPLP